MSSESSSKKVRKAARVGSAGPRRSGERKLGFPLAIAGIVLLGGTLVAVSRADRAAEADVRPSVSRQDHWHAAYGIFDCDDWVTQPLADVTQDRLGMHTHEDFLIHMHPVSSAVAGNEARLDNWGETVGLELTDDSITVDSAGLQLERSNGDKCGDEPGVLRVKVWSTHDSEGVELDEPIETELDGDFASYQPRDGDSIAIAFVPEGTELEKPPASIRLEDPNAAEENRDPEPIPGFDDPSDDAFVSPPTEDNETGTPLRNGDGTVPATTAAPTGDGTTVPGNPSTTVAGSPSSTSG